MGKVWFALKELLAVLLEWTKGGDLGGLLLAWLEVVTGAVKTA